MLIILSTGCSRPTKPLDPLAADTIMAPAYPRSTMGDEATARVAAELTALAKNRQTPTGEILFDRCDVLPPVRSILPYGAGQYEQQTRLPIILTTASGWNKLDSATRQIELRTLFVAITQSTQGLASVGGPTITVVNPRGWQVA
ncbi:MAG: hypothetical protein EBS30_19235, partial [Planctomycetes bacterium]|nr:hypothetical protein [Planctomycetota bacterium]